MAVTEERDKPGFEYQTNGDTLAPFSDRLHMQCDVLGKNTRVSHLSREKSRLAQ
jgi:hypothetical protein